MDYGADYHSNAVVAMFFITFRYYLWPLRLELIFQDFL